MEYALTARQVLVLKAVLSYAFSNIDCLNDAFEHGDHIEVGGIVTRCVSERDVQSLQTILASGKPSTVRLMIDPD